MKFFIPLICVFALTLAEPPVGDGYPASRAHGHHDHENHIEHSDHHHDHKHDHGSSFQRSPAQEYGPPLARTFGSPAQEYGTPNTRHSHHEPAARNGLSQEYGVPSSRALSQEYGPPAFRTAPSSEYIPASRGLSQEYGVPNADEFGAQGRQGLSQEYGVPSARNSFDSFAHSPSPQYGVPELRSAEHSQGYPSARTSQSYLPPSRSQFRSLSQEYGVPRSNQGYPAARSSFRSASRSHSAPASSVSRNFAGTSRSFGSSNSLSTKYGLPAAARSDSYLEGYKVSQSYGTPSQRSPSETYGAPSQDAVGQEPVVVAARAGNLKTTAVASSFAAAKSSPSAKYGAPSATVREAMPSEQYGVPDSDSESGQGYNYARNALDELINQEPANYDFAYKVSDLESGSDFGHTESRQDNRAEGSYFVVLPDGTKQVVEYEADERGFKPRISVEPAEVRSGGYDDNAADLTRDGEGPY